jgi:hypothetical protein
VLATSVEAFPHRRGAHCASSALRDLLEHHSLSYFEAPLSEGFVFGLGGGLDFLYTDHADAPLPVYLLGRSNGFEADLCRHLGVELDVRSTEDAALGWAWLRDELQAGRPTMVFADIKHLEYLDVRLHNSHHDVVVVADDPGEGRVWVADHDRDRLEPCSYGSLARARNSDGFPGPNRHTTWIARFPERLPDPRRAVADAIGTAVRNMRAQAPPLGTPYAVGLDGVQAFAGAYPEWPARFDGRLPRALKALRLFIARAGTGGALFRSLWADFLAEAADLLGDRSLAGPARTYRELSESWAELARRARGPDPAAAHADCLDLVADVARLEHAGVSALEGRQSAHG